MATLFIETVTPTGLPMLVQQPFVNAQVEVITEKRGTAPLYSVQFLASGIATLLPNTPATLTTSGAANGLLLLSSNGAGGNAVTFAIATPGGAAPLSIAVSGKAITVTPAYSGSAITTTAAQLLAALLNNRLVTSLTTPALAPGNDGTGLVTAHAAQNLSGGVSSALSYGVKETGEYDGGLMATQSTWNEPLAGNGPYTAQVSYNTSPINTDLHSPDGNPANDLESVTYMAEFSWLPPGASLPTATDEFSVIVLNKVLNGSEGAPISFPIGSPILFVASLPTSTAALSIPVCFFVPGAPSAIWELRAGTDAADGVSISHPPDYDPTSNQRVFARVL